MLATLSYSIYLTHKITVHITQDYITDFQVAKDSNMMFFICMITSVLAALLVNKIIEHPFLLLRQRILKN